MSKFKKRLTKRAIAFLLSGAMILSDAAMFPVTAYAAEETTGGGYSEEYIPETEKENNLSDEKIMDEGNAADDTADENTADDAADNVTDENTTDEKTQEPAQNDAEDTNVRNSDAAEEDASKAADSDENTTDAESAVEDATTVETVVEKVSEEVPMETEEEEKTAEEASDVEVTEEAVDNQASSADITKGLTTGTQYGDNILKFYVLEDMPYGSSVVVAGSGLNPKVDGKALSDENGWIPNSGAAFKIEALKASKISFQIKSADNKTYYFVKDDGAKGEIIKSAAVSTTKNETHTFEMDAGETYYFYVAGSRVSVFKITWEEREVEIDESTRTPWTEVDKPVIAKPVLDETDSSKINVTVTGLIGINGADSMTVSMYNADEYNAESTENTAISSLASEKYQEETTFTFAPTASGNYLFVAEMMRKTQDTKLTSDPSEPISFTCPLVPPTNLVAESLGGGKVQIRWTAVPEVDQYIVEVVDKPDIVVDPVEGTKTSVTISGLTKGETYSFKIYSVKMDGETELKSDPSEVVSCKVTDAKLTWETRRFGNGIDSSNNKSTKLSDNSVRLVSKAGKGKIVPASTDGLMFYCTTVPSNKNFIFSANAHVNEWTFSNGQEGFGVMAADRVGKDGTGGEFWNNSYQAVVSRISYKWNGTDISTDDTGQKIEMQIGVGSTEKVGVKASDVSGISSGELEVPKRFRASQTAIDSTFATYGTGQYNIVANCTNPPMNSDKVQYEDFYLQVQRNNTGYFVSYTKYKKDSNGKDLLDENGNKILDPATTKTAKYYERDALNSLDKNNIYVGVFTSRNADVTFSDMTLETTDPAEDADAEPKEVKYYNLSTSVLSSTVSNSRDYQFIFHSNWNGKLVLKDSAGNILSKEKGKDKDGNEVELDYCNVTGSLDPEIAYLQDGTDDKNTKKYIDIKNLSIGKNVFTVEYTPDKSWSPDVIDDHRYAELNSYNKVTLTYTVEYRKYGEPGQTIYVSQYGKATNIGTKESPLDIYTAVKYAQPGQTILLAGGTYQLNRTLQTPRGVDGKPDKGEDGKETYNNYIKMMAEDPENRPVLDFMSLVPAVVTVGDYWYFKNIDVTRCKDGEKGIQVSSSHCVFDRVDTYKNGSTGLQISRLASQDTYKDWPSDNLILNCNSYLNVDEGYEDADGFAAKLTSGSNNVFDGCIAAFNADDGWDLFAKVQSGSIGAVTIQNCIAYRNGYVLEKDGKEGAFDEFGKLRKGKGNGNGFKMGGDGLQGGSIYDPDYDESADVRKSGHKIYNSLAFYNKMKGFDSNSCPNVKAYNCVSFNNEGSNIGFTSATKNPNTDFELQNVVSFKTDVGRSEKDSVASTGTQDKKKWSNTSAYLWDASSKTSKNSAGNTVKESDFVSLKYDSLNCVDKEYWRNPDGTINTHGFLSIKEDSSLLAKPAMGGTASNKVESGEDTDGSIKGAIETEDVTDDYGEDFPESGINYNSGHYGKIWIADIDYLDYTDREPIEYTGKAITPELHVRFSADLPLLTKGKDYTVKYYKEYDEDKGKGVGTAKEAGTAIAEVTGVGNYKGYTATKEFVIQAIDVNDYTVSIPESIIVKENDLATVSKQIKPTWQGKALKKGVDYTIEQDSTDPNKYIVEGGHEEQVQENAQAEPITKRVGNFREKKIVTVIKEADVPLEQQMSKASVTIKDKNLYYTGSRIEPKDVEVKINGVVITEGFKTECTNNLEVGKATLTVIGDGINYFGSKSVNFTIKKGNLKDVADVTFHPSFVDGDQLKSVEFSGTDCAIPENRITVKLKSDDPEAKAVPLVNGVDYKIVQKGTDKAGTATVTIKGINQYTGSLAYKFNITAKDINEIPEENFIFYKSLPYVVSGVNYNAGENFNIKVGDDYVDTKHYTLSYKNNNMVSDKDAAKAPTVVVTGRNGLKGKRTFTFSITSAEMTDNTNIVVSAKDITTNGKPLKYSDLRSAVISVTHSYEINGKVKTKKLSAGRDYDKNEIHYFIDKNNNFEIDSDEEEITSLITSGSKDIVDGFEEGGKGYATVLVRVGTENEDNAYNYKGTVDGYFRAALYDINKAKVINKKSRVYGLNWKTGNGLSVVIDWSDTEVAKLDDYIHIHYKTTNVEAASTEEEDLEIAKYGPKLECNDLIGDYKKNKNNAAKYYAMDGFVIDTDSYKKNDRVGTASFTIVGTGQYAGTKKVPFKIINKETGQKLIAKGKAGEVEPFIYEVKVTSNGNGTIKTDKIYVEQGKIVSLTASPKGSYVDDEKKEHFYAVDKFEMLEGNELVTDVQIDEVDQFAHTYQFEMPEGNVSIKAIFGEGYSVTVASDGNGTVNGQSEASTTVMEGRTVTFTTEPKEKYCVDKFEITEDGELVTDFEIKEIEDNKYQFTMPKKSVSIKAVFKKEDAK